MSIIGTVPLNWSPEISLNRHAVAGLLIEETVGVDFRRELTRDFH